MSNLIERQLSNKSYTIFTQHVEKFKVLAISEKAYGGFKKWSYTIQLINFNLTVKNEVILRTNT